MSDSRSEALFSAGVALVVILAIVAARRARRGGAPPSMVVIPERWASLRQLHPQAQARFLALFLLIEARTGGKVIYGPNSGYRPGLKAGELPAYHFFGLAHDINVVLPDGSQLMMGTPKQVWEASGVPAIIRAAGFRWGGDFSKPEVGAREGDPVHVDLGTVYPIAALRSAALARAGRYSGFDARQLPLVA